LFVILPVVPRDLLPRREQPLCLRFVAEGLGILERSQNSRRVVMQAALRRIRDRQVNQFRPGSTHFFPCLRISIRGQFPVRSLGEHFATRQYHTPRGTSSEPSNRS